MLRLYLVLHFSEMNSRALMVRLIDVVFGYRTYIDLTTPGNGPASLSGHETLVFGQSSDHGINHLTFG
jgi:hypothetical protein